MRIPVAFAPEQPGGSGGGGSGPRPSAPYWHLWTDESGVSHQTRCELTEWELRGVGGAEPQWNDQQARSEATVVFTVQPVGWIGDWHENPAPQWIVVLSGRSWIESMDGTRIEQGPGEFSVGEDQGCVQMRRAARGTATAPARSVASRRC